MAISRRVPKDLADLLTRAKASGLTDDEIHDRAGLPGGWLSGARRGRYGPAAASWKKLLRFLERLDEGGRFVKIEEEKRSEPPPPLLSVDREGAIEPVEPRVAVLEPDGGRTPIGKAILKANTFRRLGALSAMIAAAAADNVIELKLAEILDKSVKTRSAILKKEREEQATAKVRALDILTAEEVKLLAEHRAKLAGPPLKPGEYPPPPEAEPKEKADA